MDSYFEKLRKEMVKNQLIPRNIYDPHVISAMEKVPRHIFVPNSLKTQAYEDYPLSIGYGQTVSQPYVVALMVQLARLQKDYEVLEIGTGSGYETAVLAELVEHVYSIELVEALAKSAKQHLNQCGYTNLTLKTGDGYLGWAECAPFDAIIVTAAANEVPSALLEQLKINGRLIIPIGDFLEQYLVRITKTPTGFKKEIIMPVKFVPFIRAFNC